MNSVLHLWLHQRCLGLLTTHNSREKKRTELTTHRVTYGGSWGRWGSARTHQSAPARAAKGRRSAPAMGTGAAPSSAQRGSSRGRAKYSRSISTISKWFRAGECLPLGIMLLASGAHCQWKDHSDKRCLGDWGEGNPFQTEQLEIISVKTQGKKLHLRSIYSSVPLQCYVLTVK